MHYGKMNPSYKKVVFYTALGMLSAMMLVTCIERGNGAPSAPKNVIVRNHRDGGFFANIPIVTHLIHTCERSKQKLVILLDSGLYQEGWSHFTADNPCYNKYDWFSCYFEPINQTNKPVSYWEKWVTWHPLAQVITPNDLKPVISHSIMDERLLYQGF